ncbi:MAG: hypothetical protein MH252_03415, partial [Thermosynechococcaceae cyanobacterium MS004]|nr:hypothetical protein [Thermosynechococcaceae cyanobacterium MS004]
MSQTPLKFPKSGTAPNRYTLGHPPNLPKIPPSQPSPNPLQHSDPHQPQQLRHYHPNDPGQNPCLRLATASRTAAPTLQLSLTAPSPAPDSCAAIADS